MRPTHSARVPRGGAPRGYSSQKDPLPEREDQERVERRDNIVGHHAEAVMPLAVDEPGRGRLDHVEHPEQQERDRLAQRLGADEEQDEQERRDFVPYDGAGIGYTEI